ncbi:MAG TPA: hypothetical protein PKK76_06595, partial [Leptospiraceae bacterium]|nr:hypothetical protein [Leptospiraceae bacterium]
VLPFLVGQPGRVLADEVAASVARKLAEALPRIDGFRGLGKDGAGSDRDKAAMWILREWKSLCPLRNAIRP